MVMSSRTPLYVVHLWGDDEGGVVGCIVCHGGVGVVVDCIVVCVIW